MEKVEGEGRGGSVKKHKARRDAFSVLARAVGTFLNQKGWEVFVVGDPYIQHPLGAREHTHEFVVRITAVKRVKNAVES